MPHTPFFTATTRRTVSLSVSRANTPDPAKPVTVREATVTSSTLRSLVPITQMPLPLSPQPSAAFFTAGATTVPGPMPRRVIPGVLTLTLSRYVPEVTSTVSPAPAASTAFWIDSPGKTTWV